MRTCDETYFKMLPNFSKFLALEFTGGVPYELLRPVLERASAVQLFALENYNPYLLEDTDELWKVLCQKKFRTAVREEMETWRDLYLVCCEILEKDTYERRLMTSYIYRGAMKSLKQG